MQPTADPWSLEYWRDRLSRGDVPACVAPEVFHDPEKASLALEACFEARDWDAASAIAKGWFPRLNVNRTSNKAPWVRREVLYFLRGKTEARWVELLLSGQASMKWDDTGSALYEAINEVDMQLRSNDTEGLPRLFHLVPKLLENGAKPDDGPHLVNDLISSMGDRVARLAPESLDQWNELRLIIARASDLASARLRVEIRLEDAISKEDFLAITELAGEFSSIPRPHRLLCPISEVLARHEKRPRYPVVAVMAALLQGGLSAREACTWGEAPLSLVINHRCMPEVARGLVEVLLNAGANPDQAAEHTWRSDTGVVAMDRPLHGCAYRIQPPIDALVAGGASVDVRDNRGLTPLLYAARECNLEAMEALILAGADVQAVAEESRGVAFEYLENIMRPEKDFDIEPSQMAQGCVLLASRGVDLDVSFDGKSAWGSVFSCLDSLMSRPRAERLAREFVQGLVDSGYPFNWHAIQAAARPHECARPALSIIDALLLERGTTQTHRATQARRM